jgi:hypothetical protein
VAWFQFLLAARQRQGEAEGAVDADLHHVDESLTTYQ